MDATADDLARDLLADLALCEAATAAPWLVSSDECRLPDACPATKDIVALTPGGEVFGVFVAEIGCRGDEMTDELNGDTATADQNAANAAMIVAARKGWPAAIRRALAAEAEVARLRKSLKQEP